MNTTQFTTGTINRREILRGGAAIVGSVALGAPVLAQTTTAKLGVLMPFSGGLELFGAQAMQGIEMLVDEVNAAGGVLGRQIEIIKADNRTDPKTSVERAQQLIHRDKVDAVIGPITSAARDAIKSSIERGRKPLLYATDYEGGVCSDFIACYSALPAHYVDPLIPYLMETVGRHVYLFGADYVWPQKMNAAIRTAVEGAGGEVVGGMEEGALLIGSLGRGWGRRRRPVRNGHAWKPGRPSTRPPAPPRPRYGPPPPARASPAPR